MPAEEYVSPHELEELETIDSPDNAHRWMAFEGAAWSVRGANYLADRKKVPSATGSQHNKSMFVWGENQRTQNAELPNRD